MATKALTQAQTIASIADAAGISKKEAKTTLEALQTAIIKNDKVATPFGIFTKKIKPARPARKGINPFTGEEAMFKAKPKSTVVKYRPNKATKDAVS